MAFQKKIVTPAGNVLGDYGVIVGIIAQHMHDGLHANTVAIALYNSQADADADKPCVTIYRYPLGNLIYQPADLEPITAAILKTKDNGIWDATRPERQAWIPGWEGAEIVTNPKGVGL